MMAVTVSFGRVVGRKRTRHLQLIIGQCLMVPSKGLEPPHRCRYMDLNHARLPIPPRWQVDDHHGAGKPPYQEDLHSYSTGVLPRVKLLAASGGAGQLQSST